MKSIQSRLAILLANIAVVTTIVSMSTVYAAGAPFIIQDTPEYECGSKGVTFKGTIITPETGDWAYAVETDGNVYNVTLNAEYHEIGDTYDIEIPIESLGYGTYVSTLNLYQADEGFDLFQKSSSKTFTLGDCKTTNESSHKSSSKGATFSEDTRCHWQKPSEIIWVKLEPKTVAGKKGMYLTWAQSNATKVSIKIDDGTGNYPWTLDKTSNDGHEFLPNVQSWQNVKIKAYNECKSGDWNKPVSYSAYPNGWYNIK